MCTHGPSGIRQYLTTLMPKPDIDLEHVKSTAQGSECSTSAFFQIKIVRIAAFVRNMPKWPVPDGEIGPDYV